MAHCQKFTRAAIGHMLEHYNRTGANHNRQEQNIDRERSHENYILSFRDDDKSDKEFLDDRLSELTFRHQKNNVVLADWVVTLPKDFKGDEERFFSLTAEFIGNRYGQENIINCYVHRDETTPHMHCAFVPVKTDKDGIERLSSNRVNIHDLNSFHHDLERFLEHEKCHARLLNGRTEQEHIRADKAEYARDYMEKQFEYYIKQDPEFYNKMNRYIEREMAIDKDIMTRENIERDREIDRDKEREYTPKA